MASRIQQLSLAALQMAASGLPAEADVLAQWLYRFGTVPRGPAIERDFGPDDDPMAVLGITIGGRVRRLLESTYDATTYSGWYSLARRTAATQLIPDCKLYVSPKPQLLGDTFPVIADVFARLEVRSFKVGRGIEGLLRPDKIMAYFDERAHMLEVASALAKALRKCPAQGVPFTTALGADGLLSWAIDPPPGYVAASWRSWVTKRLAAGLAARRSVQCVLDDMRATGVDPDTWRASADAFREEVMA